MKLLFKILSVTSVTVAAIILYFNFKVPYWYGFLIVLIPSIINFIDGLMENNKK